MIPFQVHRRIPLVRRPFYQRDKAVTELAATLRELEELRARSAAELAAVVGERDHLRAHYVETANVQLPAMPFARTAAPAAANDSALVGRIIAAYLASIKTPTGAPGSFWNAEFVAMKRDVHDALVSGDIAAVQALLRDPGATDLFYGFDNLARSLLKTDPDAEGDSILSYQGLLRLATAVGARRHWNPEGPKLTPAAPDVETLLTSLDHALGARIDFPNPFPRETGLLTSRGVVSYRAVQAVYQAWRIFRLVGGNTSARVLEIGGGMGRTAYYARLFGIHDYSMIDIPLSAVAQANFLGRVAGPEAISLFGETRPGIRVLPPVAFLDAADHYDIVLNVDSLTELAPDNARAYCAAIKERAGLFLSINHEVNAFTVRDMCAELGMPEPSRTPYWMRAGYVDELFRLSP